MRPVDKNKTRVSFPYNALYSLPKWFKKGFRHKGIDFAPNVPGDPREIKVKASVRGMVEHAGWQDDQDHKKGFGLYVRILFLDNAARIIERHYFGHLSRLDVHEGQIVEKGDVLGLMGSTGYSTAKHLHYEIRRRGKEGKFVSIDPAPYLT